MRNAKGQGMPNRGYPTPIFVEEAANPLGTEMQHLYMVMEGRIRNSDRMGKAVRPDQ